jgi:hypothetical protein
MASNERSLCLSPSPANIPCRGTFKYVLLTLLGREYYVRYLRLPRATLMHISGYRSRLRGGRIWGYSRLIRYRALSIPLL